MRKTLVFGLALALVSGVAYANFCARDVVPAASLLVPYAVVDLNADGTPNTSGYTTLFAVTNVSSDLVLVHFTAWSAQSVHVVDWDEVLTGYDVWTINFRDLLTGHFDYFDTGSPLDPVPVTGPPPYGPTTNVSAAAVALVPPVDVPAAGITGCNFPYGYRPTLGPIIVSKLQQDIYAQPTQYVASCKTGVPNFPSPAWLVGLTKNPVFFYVTADVVAACNTAFPDESGYWNNGPASNGNRFPLARNVIIGDVIWVNFTSNFSESMPAVHLEADPDAITATGFRAFYDRYANIAAPVQQDDREPLATAFAFRYINTGGVTTQAMVWKDSLEVDRVPCASKVTGIVCACQPYIYYAFDENENASARGGGGPSGFDIAEPNVIPFETQAAPINATNWDGIPASNGWMLLVFDPSLNPPRTAATTTHQAWVAVRYLLGGYSTATEAAVIANVNCFSDQILPRLGINYNYMAPAQYPQATGFLP